jgi:PAS domain S-box-containing protein
MRSPNETILRFCEAENLDDAMGILLNGVCEEIGWPVGQAWVVADDDSGLVCSAAWHCGTDGIQEFRRASTSLTIRDDDELPGRVWGSDQPVWVPDLTKEPLVGRMEEARRSGLRTAVAVPALDTGRAVAVLELFHPRAMKLEPKLLRSLCDLGADIGPLVRRKRDEDAARRNEERLRRFATVVHDAIWEWDLETGRLAWNHGLQRHFGYTPDAVGGDHDWRAARIHPEDRERVVASLFRAVERGDTRWSEHYRFMRGDGSATYVVDRGCVVRGEDHRPLAMMGAMLDLTPPPEAYAEHPEHDEETGARRAGDREDERAA